MRFKTAKYCQVVSRVGSQKSRGCNWRENLVVTAGFFWGKRVFYREACPTFANATVFVYRSKSFHLPMDLPVFADRPFLFADRAIFFCALILISSGHDRNIFVPRPLLFADRPSFLPSCMHEIISTLDCDNYGCN